MRSSRKNSVIYLWVIHLSNDIIKKCESSKGRKVGKGAVGRVGSVRAAFPLSGGASKSSQYSATRSDGSAGFDLVCFVYDGDRAAAH